MSVAWGIHCMSPLAPATSIGHVCAGGRDLPPRSVSKAPVFIESSFLLILAAFVYSNQHCPLSTYLPVFASGFGALC